MRIPIGRASRALLALAAGTVLLAAGVSTAETAPRPAPEAPPGASGIGDPYFPLDGNGGIDVVSYDIHDRYDFRTRTLSGWTTLRVTGTGSAPGFSLDLMLPVQQVTVNGQPVTFRKEFHELEIDHALEKGVSFDVRVDYAGRPDKLEYAGTHPWHATKTEVVTNGEPHMAPWWFPANDHPADKATMRISVTVPTKYQVISNGRQVSRTEHRGADAGRDKGWATTTWQAKEPMVPYLAFFAAGRYWIDKGTSGGTPWLVAVSRDLTPRKQRESMALLRRTPQLLNWVERDLGAYPFSTVGGVTHGISLWFALENQTRPTYPYMRHTSAAEQIVVHELAHQWFGNSVALSRWSDIWLNEGIATFMEWRWRELVPDETGKRHPADEWLQLTYEGSGSPGSDFWTRTTVADPCPERLRSDCRTWLFDFPVYQRGGMAMQALRNRIGERDFWRLLRRWIAVNAGGHGTTEEFEAMAAKVSGDDLDGFFKAWLHTAKRPAKTAANGLR